MTRPARTFTSSKATRQGTKLLLALIGPSGAGKTLSSLRLARGIQAIDPGPIYFIDTEAGRALEYADSFDFEHVPFAAPFGSLDYLEAIKHCISKGAKTIIIDNMSHEHAGPGGMLERAEQWLIERSTENGKIDWKKYNANKLGSYVAPKADRTKLLYSGFLTASVNFILCFRAKEKIKPAEKGAKDENGKEDRNPKQLGWQPIGDDDFFYEMTARFLLRPAANGVPSWSAEHASEAAVFRCPEQFRQLFSKPEALSEKHGEAMATWAANKKAPKGEISEALERIAKQATLADLRQFAADLRSTKSWSDDERAAIKAAVDSRQEEIKNSGNREK